MQILYKYQVIKLEKYSKPAIFLGYDIKDDKKIWCVRLNDDGEPFVDWFMISGIQYVQIAAENKSTPNGRQIFFGKYKLPWVNGYYATELTPEEISKFGTYVKTLTKKEENEQK